MLSTAAEPAATATPAPALAPEAAPAEAHPTVEKTEEGQKSGPPISCPLVLQCAGCRVIVGDTCSVVDLNPAWRTITLQSALRRARQLTV